MADYVLGRSAISRWIITQCLPRKALLLESRVCFLVLVESFVLNVRPQNSRPFYVMLESM